MRNMHSFTKQRSLALPALLLIILALGLAACGETANTSNGGGQAGAGGNEVAMGITNFVQTSVAIDKGQSVHFVDQQSGAAHIICVGKDGKCDLGSKPPTDLANPGFTIQPGQSHDVRFETAGTYAVTCTLHPTMNMTITVR